MAKDVNLGENMTTGKKPQLQLRDEDNLTMGILRSSSAESNELPFLELSGVTVDLDSSRLWSYAPKIQTQCDIPFEDARTIRRLSHVVVEVYLGELLSY